MGLNSILVILLTAVAGYVLTLDPADFNGGSGGPPVVAGIVEKTSQLARVVDVGPKYPELSLSFVQTSESYGATYLKARGDCVGELSVSNTGEGAAEGVKVVLSSPNGYFSDETVSFGDVGGNTDVAESVDLNFLSSVLDVTTDEDVTIEAVLSYSSGGERLSSQESFDFHIAGRNYMTWSNPDMVVSWVTPTQPKIREFAAKATSGLGAGMDSSDPTVQKMAARWLFESMRAYGVHYVNDAHSSRDYVQFPYETLKNKAGDCDDNAILYASLLEAIGMKSFLVLVPGHIFSGYISSEGHAVPIETTSEDFDRALSKGSAEYAEHIEQGSYTLIYPSERWGDYPQVNLPEKTELAMPSITKQVGECKLTWGFSLGYFVKNTVKFVNTGAAPGAGCAAMMVYDITNWSKIDEDISCWTLNPGETKEDEYVVDISASEINDLYCETK